jgi:hypothetical protein
VSAVVRRLLAKGPLVSRIVAAIFGGYGLAALSSIAVLALPVAPAQAVIGGVLASFAVYAGAVVWVFAVRSARRAWVGLAVAAAALAIPAGLVWTGAGA